MIRKLLGLVAITLATSAMAQRLDDMLPTGQRITPLAAPGSSRIALDPQLAPLPALRLGFGVNAVLSPDRRLLALVTSGTNTIYDVDGKPVAPSDGDFILIYDVTGTAPMRIATLPVRASFGGLAWRADGKRLYAALGVGDAVQAFAPGAGGWAPMGEPIKLNHAAGIGGERTQPLAAGIALIDGGARLAVANRLNDSVSIVDLASGAVTELDLRPGNGATGGTSPYWIAATTGSHFWVTSQRDRELIEVDGGAMPRVLRRVALKGVPNRVIANAAGTKLFVAEDNSDLIEIVDAGTARIVGAVPTLPDTPSRPRGATPNSLALSIDERVLYATNGGTNAVAVIDLAARRPRLSGMIPTG